MWSYRVGAALEVDSLDGKTLHWPNRYPNIYRPVNCYADETSYDVEAMDSHSIRVRDYPLEQATDATSYCVSWTRS